jgi:hypothetical protein
MERLKPDVIAHVSPNEARDWHPVIILLRRDDANRMAIGINMLLRAVAEAGGAMLVAEDMSEADLHERMKALVWRLAGLPAQTRKAMAEVALALDVRLVAVPSQKGSQDLKAQAGSDRWGRLYDIMSDDLNPNSKPFNEEPGSLYARCGHKKVAEVSGRIRCGKADCPNYVRKALAEWEEENGAAQPGQGAN